MGVRPNKERRFEQIQAIQRQEDFPDGYGRSHRRCANTERCFRYPRIRIHPGARLILTQEICRMFEERQHAVGRRTEGLGTDTCREPLLHAIPRGRVKLPQLADDVAIVERPPSLCAIARICGNWYDVPDEESDKHHRKLCAARGMTFLPARMPQKSPRDERTEECT
jgi:hypothetical protein